MIKSAPYFWVACDGCGLSAQEGSDHAAWSNEMDAVEVAMGEGSDWWSPDPGNSHYCPPCARIRQPEETETGVSA